MTDAELRLLIEADRAAKLDLTRDWRGGASLGFEIKQRAMDAEDALRKAAADELPRLLDRVALLGRIVNKAARTLERYSPDPDSSYGLLIAECDAAMGVKND